MHLARTGNLLGIARRFWLTVALSLAVVACSRIVLGSLLA